jgi:hypothetical protein
MAAFSAFRSALVAMSVFVAQPAAAVGVDGDPVLYWNQVFLGSLPFNPAQQRDAAMLNIALHDAVNASLGSPNVPFLGGLSTSGGDTRAAASVAAHAVLVALQPGRTSEFNAALAASLALVPDGAAKTSGMATGSATAAALFADRAGDGQLAVVPYTPSGLPGRWAPSQGRATASPGSPSRAPGSAPHPISSAPPRRPTSAARSMPRPITR